MSHWDMVLQRRLDYGSSGYQAPVVPHVPRSARGKRSLRKKVDDKQMCAFDLLATVAGKLLLEQENSEIPCNNSGSSNPVVAKETVQQGQIYKKSFKFEAFDQLSCNEDFLGPENVLKKQTSCDFKEHSLKAMSGPASIIVKSEMSHEDAIGGESKFLDDSRKIGHSVDSVSEKYTMGQAYSSSVESLECKKDRSKTPVQVGQQVDGNAVDGSAPYRYSLDDPMDLDVKPHALVSSDSSAEVPVYRNNIPRNNSFPKQEDDMDLVVNKDDENSSGCTHPSVVTNKPSRLQRIGDRRIRKLLASKFWKIAPTMLQNDVEKKPSLQSKRMCHTRQRTQRSSFKRRKLFDNYSVSTCDGGIYSKGVSNLCERGGIKVETNDLHATLCGANGASSSTTGQKPCYSSPDYHVKLSIKSFKVPELVIEIPETATVGSLKRTVLEAVTAILGGGLRVGVLLQGKKVRNDNKTLHQAGISDADKLDNLSFTLEPNPKQAPMSLTNCEDPHFLTLGCTPEPLARIPPVAPVAVDLGESDATQPLPACPESDKDSVHSHSPTDASSLEKTTANSLALVAVPPMNVEALAMVPLRNKPKRTEVTQRRVRRPFSVAEVEALVQAVEMLGTGRWRDVKLCAFENAKHRTYVDLKDKWKTLVHTARISPQQRRGEPVPQELLDRVLTAHAYWSQQQTKLQQKPPPSAGICLSYPNKIEAN